MALVLTSFGVAVAALCVWLAVRIVNRRERWAKWTLALVVGLPVLYVLSFGPGCRITSRVNFGAEAVEAAYRPITLAMSRSATASKVLQWYARLAAPRWMWIEGRDWMWSNLDEELDFGTADDPPTSPSQPFRRDQLLDAWPR